MNILEFKNHKVEHRKISMVTCYDHWTARILDQTEIDCVLVGDSVAMVVHGHPSTVHATVEMMALHTSAVARGLGAKKLLVADLPFLSFRKGSIAALEAVDLLMKAGAQSVKLEGVWGHEETVRAIVQSGVPVMGHIGLTPQSIHGLGGFKVQGKLQEEARDLVIQARKLEELGCFALVLECVPAPLAKEITETIQIPTIGIGAGIDCDGQVLVLQDLLGGNLSFKPKFLRRFAEAETMIKTSVDRFCAEVNAGSFPSAEESYS